ncbi:MAG: DUF4230 domain-containing protein [Prevotella sp.]|nr:DUF4230 domain-containing protein [Prevotella sp.]
MKHILIYTALCLAALYSCSGKKTEAGREIHADTIPMMLTVIKNCSRLYTAEYHIHKIVTHNDTRKLRGTFLQKQFDITLPLGERKIAIPMDATLKAYVDFSEFSEKNISRKGDKIEIILPDPKVELTSSRISHKDIKKQVPLLRSTFSDAEMASYEQQGRASIIASIPQTGIIDMAQKSAARILIPMIEQMGFKEENITVTFRKKFSLDDIPQILINNGIENGKRQ